MRTRLTIRGLLLVKIARCRELEAHYAALGRLAHEVAQRRARVRYQQTLSTMPAGAA